MPFDLRLIRPDSPYRKANIGKVEDNLTPGECVQVRMNLSWDILPKRQFSFGRAAQFAEFIGEYDLRAFTNFSLGPEREPN